MAADETKRTIRLVAPDGVGPFLVNRMTGTEALSRLFEYRVDALSEDGEIAFADVVGQPITLIIAARARDAERIVTGYVSHFGMGERLGRYTEYQLVIVPYLWFADRVAECRIMPPNLTVPEIVKRVLLTRMFADVDDRRLTGHYVPRPYCVQYRETDFNFISRLLEEEGIYYYFEHAREGQDKFKHTLVLCDAPGVHKPGPGCEALHIADEGSRVAATVSAWHAAARAHPHQAHLTDFSYEIRQPLPAGGQVAFDKLSSGAPEAAFSPPVSADVVTEAGDRHKVGALVADYPAGFHAKHQKIDRDHLASIRAEELAARRIVHRGTTHVHGVTPGASFKLDSVPAEEYLVLAAEYKGWSDVGESGIAPPPDEPYECNFEAIDLKRQYRPPRITPKPRIVGPQTALVVGDKAKNAFTDSFGNVRVKFPWDVTANDDEQCSCLVRVAEPWAGNAWGVMFMPRVGHEVVVEFLEGDPDRPLITGRLYNGLAKPPYDPRQHASVSTIKSMTTDNGKGYNELRFEDRKGSEQLFIHAQRQMDLRTGASLYETVGGNREEHIGTDDQGDRNRLVSHDLNLHAKGGVFELIEKKLNRNAKAEVVEVYEADHTIATAARQTLNAKDIVVEAKQTASLKSDKVVLQGAQALSIKADNVKIEATQLLSLKVGPSFLVLTPSGAFISGTTAFINSGGAPQPADPAMSAEAPSITTPVDAAEATSDLPGEHVAAGGPAPARAHATRPVAVVHAPAPHATPVAAGGQRAAAAAPDRDRKLLEIAWVERETYCGGAATLKGKTKGYGDGETEDAEIRNVSDGATVVGVPLAIHGNAFNQAVEVKDWLPRKGVAGFEESRQENAYAAGQKTAKPLTMRFIPTLKAADCSLKSRMGLQARFSMEVKDYVCHVFEHITYVPGRLGHLIKLGAHVPSGTGGGAKHDEGPENDQTLSGQDWRFARRHPDPERSKDKIWQFWDGAGWVDVPPDWKDSPPGTKLIGIGLWREGRRNQAQYGLTWPVTIDPWSEKEKADVEAAIADWIEKIAQTWSDKFDLHRDGCASSNPACCRYSVKVTADFKEITPDEIDRHSILLAVNKGRSNSFAWTIAEGRPSTAPHEFGHHLGCADEYKGSAVDKSITSDIPDPSQPGVDATSLMGGQPPDAILPIKARHFDIVKRQLTDMIKTQKGVTFTFTAVPHR